MLNNLTRSKPKNPPTLMSILNFNTSDLNANRTGILSKRQRKLAEATQPNLLIQLVLMGHVVGIIGILIVIVLASGVTSTKLVFLGVASMVIISPFLYAMDRMTAIQKSGLSAEDLESGEILSICGEVTCHPAPIPTQSGKIQIDNMRFTVSNTLLDLINSEQSYCVYYTSYSKRIMSVEVMP